MCRIQKKEVIELLKANEGRIVIVKNKLVEEHGPGCLEGYTKAEMAERAKDTFLNEYMGANEMTPEFADFYYANDIQDRIYAQIKADREAGRQENRAAFERNFPALSPNVPTAKPHPDSVWTRMPVGVMNVDRE